MTCIHYCRSPSSVEMRPVENVQYLAARHRRVFVFVEVGSGDPNPTPSEMSRQAKPDARLTLLVSSPAVDCGTGKVSNSILSTGSWGSKSNTSVDPHWINRWQYIVSCNLSAAPYRSRHPSSAVARSSRPMSQCWLLVLHTLCESAP